MSSNILLEDKIIKDTYWLITLCAISGIIEADEPDSAERLSHFSGETYHIARKRIREYFEYLHDQHKFMAANREKALQLLQKFCQDSASSEQAQRKMKAVIEKLSGSGDEIAALHDFFQARLRSAVFDVPENERNIQDAVEKLLIGRGLQKGQDYDREVGRVKMSVKELVPDFILPHLSLALEVKLVKAPGRVREVVDEINADIAAYLKRYRNLIFIVYDLGHIRDEIEFKYDLEAPGNVSVIVVKH